jgi:hypothetical protein
MSEILPEIALEIVCVDKFPETPYLLWTCKRYVRLYPAFLKRLGARCQASTQMMHALCRLNNLASLNTMSLLKVHTYHYLRLLFDDEETTGIVNHYLNSIARRLITAESSSEHSQCIYRSRCQHATVIIHVAYNYVADMLKYPYTQTAYVFKWLSYAITNVLRDQLIFKRAKIAISISEMNEISNFLVNVINTYYSLLAEHIRYEFTSMKTKNNTFVSRFIRLKDDNPGAFLLQPSQNLAL